MTETALTYRHEFKYRITAADALALRARLRCVMRPDVHADETGRYLIRSIYFDNAYDKALREKIDGAPRREKFHIRYYNDDLSRLTLEKKIKSHGLCLKVAAPLAKDEAERIFFGPQEWMMQSGEPLVRELYCKMKSQQLRARVLVSYVREAYVCSAGNVRVTFDSDIRTSFFHGTFLEGQIQDISATERPGQTILEVKYDAFLPSAVADALQCGNFRQSAFSKYAACRSFG